MGPLEIVENYPPTKARLGLRPGLPSGLADALIIHGSPEAFEEELVETAARAIHRDPFADQFQSIRPGQSCELRRLIGIKKKFRRFEAMGRLVEGLNAEVGLERVPDAPSKHPRRNQSMSAPKQRKSPRA